MLSYQHIYHAGNFADVQKHALLAAVLKTMRAKPAPMAVLDTHAGRGIYDLESREAGKNREFDNGITHFWPPADKSPIAEYLDIVRKLNSAEQVTRYPGSAFIAKQLLRPQDRMVVTEKHPGEIKQLQKTFEGARKIEILQKDGLENMLASLPFKELRGLVVIDPSYELKTDYKDVPKAVFQSYRKFPQGVFFIWYPIMDAGLHKEMLLQFKEAGVNDMLVSEITLEQPPEEHYRMYGSGIAIINPPWPAKTMEDITSHITQNLPQKADSRVFWLHQYNG